MVPALVCTRALAKWRAAYPNAPLINGIVIDSRIDELKERTLELNAQAMDIRNRADGEKRDITEDESKQIDMILAEFDRVEAEIARRTRIANHTAKLTEASKPKVPQGDIEPQNYPHDDTPAKRQVPRIQSADYEPRGKWGWRTFGDFASSVIMASRKSNAYVDPRLIQNAPTSLSQESIGADGGFLVPPDFRAEIAAKVMGEDSLLSRTDQLTSSGNTVTFPKDETTPWQTSGGILAYWEDEAQAISQSKLAIEPETIRLNKLTCLVPVTEELMEDAGALDTYLRRKTAEKMDWKINDAIINGNGAGKPLGLLNAASLITVSKEGSQVATTLVAENVMKMYSRLYGPCRSRSVWLINQDIEPQLYQMILKIKNVAGTENVGGGPVYLPPGGISAAPYGTLFGRPVVPTEACQTLGTVGDIILVDLSQYRTVTKTGGPRVDISIHLWFDYDVSAFRVVFRVGGQPWWSSAISPGKGSTTRSWAVALETRS